VLGGGPLEGELGGRIGDGIRACRRTAGRGCSEPEPDVSGPAGPLGLRKQLASLGVEVVRGNSLQITVIAADYPRIEVDDSCVLNVRQQIRLRAGKGERRRTELPEQFDVLLARAPDRADDCRNVRREYRENPAQTAVDG